MKKAFSLIEIIISVIIISIVVLGIIKINRQNINMAEYISFRIKNEFSNSLFLTKEALKYDKSQKDALTILNGLKISNLETRTYLKNLKRKIYIDDDLKVEEIVLPITLKAIMLKSRFGTKYYRFNL